MNFLNAESSIEEHPNSASIHRAATQWTLLAAIAGMTVYGSVEYFATGAKSLSEFAVHHLLDVSIIMLAVWVATWVVIRRSVVDPVNRVFVHLKRMAAGRIQFFEGKMHSREMADVASSINQLVARLSKTPNQGSVSEGMDSLRRLRVELSKVSKELGDSAVPIMRSLNELEGSLLHILSDLPDSKIGQTPKRSRMGRR